MVWLAIWYKIGVVFRRVIKGALFRHKIATLFPRRAIIFGAMKTALPQKTVGVAGMETEASLLFPARRQDPFREGRFTTVAKALANWRGCGIRLRRWSGG
jgi:hypothetical protein